MEALQKIKVDIAVIIPFYNDAERLEMCVGALQVQSIDRAFHIVAVDNGSDTHPSHLTQKYPNLTILKENKPGSYSARNKALEYISANIYAFTDADCIPSPRWLEEAVSVIESKNVSAVGGAVTLFCNEAGSPTSVEIIDMIKAFPQKDYVEKQNYAVTANLVFTQEALDKTGKFNDNLKSGGDKDWCLRYHSNGGRLIYSKEASVAHPARETLKEHETKMRRVVHGAYARRKGDKNTAKFLNWKNIILGFMPPVRKAKVIWQQFPSVSASTRFLAICNYWYVNAYAATQKLKCHLGLVKEAERR